MSWTDADCKLFRRLDSQTLHAVSVFDHLDFNNNTQNTYYLRGLIVQFD